MFELYGVDVRFHQESVIRDHDQHIADQKALRLVPDVVRRMHTCAGNVRNALRVSGEAWPRPIGVNSARARRMVAS